MLRRNLLAAAMPAIASGRAGAAPAAAGRLVVVELFTSQSCSSCPPADAVLAAMVRDGADVLALSFHVTYWDRLGWRDRFSLPAATERQRRYAATLGHGQVYTPQMVVQGRRDAVGSDRAAVRAAIQAADDLAVPVRLAANDAAIRVEAGASAGAGALWLVGYDRHHSTAVGGGENGGRTLNHTHVVRSLAPLGAWQGQPLKLDAARPAGERVAVMLQAANGAIVGAASL